LPSTAKEVYKKKGWLLPFLFAYDELLWGRWNYWFAILQKGTVKDSGPIPKIQWAPIGDSKVCQANKMLRHCLEKTNTSIDSFSDWLLWGLGQGKEIDYIPTEINEYYYRNFDLFQVLDAPTDYLSMILSEHTGPGYKSSIGYFPTPFSLAQIMIDLLENSSCKTKTIYDPCVGCGSLILAASNYFLNVRGEDISSISVKLCKIQCFWYAPWFALHPENIQGLDI
jgi:hypothetical protein